MKTLKEWKLEEAARRGVSYRAICSALSRGRIPYPRVVRLNARLVLVLEPEPTKAPPSRGPMFRVPVTRSEFLRLPMHIRDRALHEMADRLSEEARRV